MKPSNAEYMAVENSMGPKELASGAEVTIVLQHSLFFDMMQLPMNNTTCLYLTDFFF
jgi:hypothetical protein